MRESRGLDLVFRLTSKKPIHKKNKKVNAHSDLSVKRCLSILSDVSFTFHFYFRIGCVLMHLEMLDVIVIFDGYLFIANTKVTS